MGEGCEVKGANCDWEHCHNRCPSFGLNPDFNRNINPNFTGLVTSESDQDQFFELVISTTMSQDVGKC